MEAKDMNDRQLEQALKEEFKRWGLAGMFLGAKPDHPAFKELPGLNIDLIKLEFKIDAIIEMLAEHADISEEMLQRRFNELLYTRLSEIRKEVQAAQELTVVKKSILGPNGQPMH